jgi:putative CocE/NonD family hydrolase
LYEVVVERRLKVPASDGVTLLTDHYRPLASGSHPALLVRTPYGRGFPWDWLYGALFAGQGFHVVIQSCRGTGGSRGVFEPYVAEAADAQATITWLREQEWFNGALSTIGPSYLGFTQWALATDPPLELRAMVVQVSTDDFYGVIYPHGVFALEAMLTAVVGAQSMHRGLGTFTLALLRLARYRRRVARMLPLIEAYPPAAGGRVRYFEDWITHPDPDDPYWVARRATVSPAVVPPASLVTGWSDVCLDQTLALYQRLREVGRDARLVVGPWTHTSGFNDALPMLFGEALEWLRQHLDAERANPGSLPVRVHVSELGVPGTWRDLAAWPPPDCRERVWYLHGDGTLTAEPPAAQAVSCFRYDPADPTPSVGGPRVDSMGAGPQRNDALESRRDVLIFTSKPLSEPLEVIGPVSLRVRARASTPHFDVFARLCDVDPRGSSWNLCDGLVRLGSQHGFGGGAGAGTGAAGAANGGWRDVSVPMSATAHRYGAGHRLRVQVSGGAHPRFARNTGTGEPLATATRLVPVEIEISDGQIQIPSGKSG